MLKKRVPKSYTEIRGLVPENSRLGRQVVGQTAELLNAETASSGGYRLNPRFSRWLMGFPAAWDSCGATAMQSCRRLQRNSSARSSTSKTGRCDTSGPVTERNE